MAQSTTIPSIQIAKQTNSKLKFIIGGLIIAFAIGYLIITGIQSSATYFLTIDELQAKGVAIENQTVRVSGWVDMETVEFDNKNLMLTFDITNDAGIERLPIVFNGPKPDQMREGTEAVVEGKFDGETFTATNLLLKCPSKYEGEPEEIQLQSVGT